MAKLTVFLYNLHQAYAPHDLADPHRVLKVTDSSCNLVTPDSSLASRQARSDQHPKQLSLSEASLATGLSVSSWGRVPRRKRPLHVSDLSKSVLCHSFSGGRLGNHLFEYASVLGIAEATNKSFFFYNDEVVQKVLKTPPVQKSTWRLRARCFRAEKLRESHGCQYDRQLLVRQEPGKDYDVGEYLQSWLYFDEIREEVREAVRFTDDIVREATQVVACLRRQFPNSTLVGIHVRRGDLITNEKYGREGCLTAPPEFFQRAMTYFRRRFSRVTFVVLGEDRKWSVEHIPLVDNDVVVLDPNSPAVDMQILAMMDHLIRTVGTFGWWAAFKMAGRPTVVFLKEFVRKGTWMGSFYTENAADYMLPSWVPM